MKKILILSCSTGQGHNSCAKAIKEYFDKVNMDCDICDALAFISRQFSKFIDNWHSRIYRYMPAAFGRGYKYSELHPNLFVEGSAIYKVLITAVEPLYRYMLKNGYDTVICTHVFASTIITRLLEKHPMEIKTAFVATDYTSYPAVEVSNLDYYFIPDEEIVDLLAECGIPKEKVKPLGIPVRQEFYKRIDKETAKENLGINKNHKHLLIMCGSMGCGPIKAMVRDLAEFLDSETEVTVICGTNKKLVNSLETRYWDNDQIHIVGYTNKISEYMDSADLYLTKPGGISVTEAGVKGLPMAFINAVAGCEQYNLEYFVKKGMAITASTSQKLVFRVLLLLNDEKKLESMRESMKDFQKFDVTEKMCEYLDIE